MGFDDLAGSRRGRTGALQLGKNIKPRQFYRSSLLPLIATTEIWIVVNYLFVCVVNDKAFEIKELVKEILFLKTLELSHMWYMPVIIGIYIALPFVSVAVKAFEDVNVMVGLIILFVGEVGISMLVLLPVYKYAKKAGKILFFMK